ncbi:MAG: hypothetical protein KF797_02905 [Flavobacteriales bacterium]|nr:hypothetical protein [Flavobacteriales bacterium]
MPSTIHPLLKRFMLACMVMLGMQLCFPPTLQASVLPTQQVDMISLGVKDPASKPGVQVDFDLPPVTVLLLLLPTWIDTPASEPPHAQDVRIPAVLPVAGYHPSAP